MRKRRGKGDVFWGERRTGRTQRPRGASASAVVPPHPPVSRCRFWKIWVCGGVRKGVWKQWHVEYLSPPSDGVSGQLLWIATGRTPAGKGVPYSMGRRIYNETIRGHQFYVRSGFHARFGAVGRNGGAYVMGT